MPSLLEISGLLGQGCTMEDFFSAAAKRQAPVISAEKCLEVAENQLAKGNKKMAWLWALRAAKAAQREKKPELQKRAQELAARLKAELAAQAVADLGQGEYWWRAATPALRPLPDINPLSPGIRRMVEKGELVWDPAQATYVPALALPDINPLSSLGQDVIEHTLTLHPVLQKMIDSECFPTRMLGQGIALTMVARKVAAERRPGLRRAPAIMRIAERMIKAARIAKLAKELGLEGLFLGEEVMEKLSDRAIDAIVKKLMKARKNGLHELGLAIGFTNSAHKKAVKLGRPDVAAVSERMLRAAAVARIAQELGI